MGIYEKYTDFLLFGNELKYQGSHDKSMLKFTNIRAVWSEKYEIFFTKFFIP